MPEIQVMVLTYQKELSKFETKQNKVQGWKQIFREINILFLFIRITIMKSNPTT